MQFIDLQAQYQAYKSEIDARIAEVLDSSRYVLGPQVCFGRIRQHESRILIGSFSLNAFLIERADEFIVCILGLIHE